MFEDSVVDPAILEVERLKYEVHPQIPQLIASYDRQGTAPSILFTGTPTRVGSVHNPNGSASRTDEWRD